MDKKIETIIEILKKRHWTIGIMESCTGGAIADSITNIPGVSEIFKCGKVTYSDEAKIEAGVDSKVVDRYGVFSMEVAKEMAKKINGEIGVGVTGNLPGEVFVAVRIKNKIINEKVSFANDPTLKATESQRATEYLNMKEKIADRKRMKREVVKKVWKMVEKVLQ